MKQPIHIHIMKSATDQDTVRALFVEYQTWLDADVCFTHFEAELKDLEAHYEFILLASASSTICGCIGLTPMNANGQGEVKRLYVQESFRNQGIARKLITSLMTQAKDRGYKSVFLDTLPTLQPAIQLYRQLDFTIKENEGDAIIRMEKHL